MYNKGIREAAKSAGVHLWQIAEELGLSDSNFSRKLRKELPSDQTDHIMQVIHRLSQTKEELQCIR